MSERSIVVGRLFRESGLLSQVFIWNRVCEVEGYYRVLRKLQQISVKRADERRRIVWPIQEGKLEMQAMTAKELEYIADSMSNEDLLIKQCAASAASIMNPQLQQVCAHMVNVHMQHYSTLLNALQQHQHLAPTQPPQA